MPLGTRLDAPRHPTRPGAKSREIRARRRVAGAAARTVLPGRSDRRHPHAASPSREPSRVEETSAPRPGMPPPRQKSENPASSHYGSPTISTRYTRAPDRPPDPSSATRWLAPSIHLHQHDEHASPCASAFPRSSGSRVGFATDLSARPPTRSDRHGHSASGPPGRRGRLRRVHVRRAPWRISELPPEPAPGGDGGAGGE